MDNTLHILIIEDFLPDYELSVRELTNGGLKFVAKRVETEQEFIYELHHFNPHLIISDYNMPDFDGMKALNLAHQHDPFLPFIVFTGSLNEEVAVNCLKAGATDYVIKESIKRLSYSVRDALRRREIMVQKNEALSKLQQSEMQLKRAQKIANIGSWELNLKTMIFIASEQVQNILGLSDDHYPLLFIQNMIAQPYRALFEQALQDHIHSGRSFDVEFQIVRNNDQGIRHVHALAELDQDKNKLTGILRDISEKKNNQMLKQEILIARESARFKHNFLTRMSHEIRTPLTGIEGMIEMLEKSDLNHTQKDYLDTLKFSSGSLKSIINDVLDLSKIEAGEMKLNPVSFLSEEIFKKAEKLFQSICKKSLTFSVRGKELLPQFLKADKQRIFQIIINLISNAVKYSHQGEIVLEACMDKIVENDLVIIKLKVHDMGPGISLELKEKLFMPFVQIHNLDSFQVEGTGLGLSICKELATLLGGEIGVDSMPGKGSTFWFTFQAQIMIAHSEAIIENTQTQTENQSAGLKILLAEDKLINQKVVTLLLNALGHTVTTALHGLEAIEKCRTEKFDLILMDIQMPVMDGITATQKLREQIPHVPPVVGLSANAFKGDREKYIALGMDDYLTKPVKSDDFVALINRLNL